MLELEQSFEKSDIVVQILAGGKGTQLLDVTGGLIPKSLVKISQGQTILDLVVQKTKSEGFDRFVYSLSLDSGCFGKEIYQHLRDKNFGVECVFEKGSQGNAISVEKLAKLTNFKYPLLVICSDMFLPWDAMTDAVKLHKNGTFTWITSSVNIVGMEKYSGLKVHNDGTVIYDINLTPEGKYLDDGNLKTVAKGGSIIIDPYLFIEAVDEIKTMRTIRGDLNLAVDIFWDVLPLIERKNLQRVTRGEKSILNTAIGLDPVMDIGTPQTLNIVRKFLENK